jgi:hypothetical protein
MVSKRRKYMNNMKQLTLIAYERPNAKDPVMRRRVKLLEKLSEQIKLANDSSYQPTKFKWVKADDGHQKRIEVPKRIKRWWGVDAKGNNVLTVRYGSKPLEMAKGKNAIHFGNENELVATLQVIATAVQAGEFDEIIERQVGAKGQKPKQD